MTSIMPRKGAALIPEGAIGAAGSLVAAVFEKSENPSSFVARTRYQYLMLPVAAVSR